MRPLADRSQSHERLLVGHAREHSPLSIRKVRLQQNHVCRVQTPTLAILVEREERIAVSTAHLLRGVADFRVAAGPIAVAGFDHPFKELRTKCARGTHLEPGKC